MNKANFIIVSCCLLITSLCLSQSLCHAQDPNAIYSKQLQLQRAEQQNLINNINYFGQLRQQASASREQARQNIAKSRAAGDKQMHTYWVNQYNYHDNQYNALSDRISRFQGMLDNSYNNSNATQAYLNQLDQHRRGIYTGGTIVPPNLSQPGGGYSTGKPGSGSGGTTTGGGRGTSNPSGGSGGIDLLGNTAR
jgi:CTP synthase (UTP-ammonia lyase)